MDRKIDVEKYAKTFSMDRKPEEWVTQTIFEKLGAKKKVLDLGTGDGVYFRQLGKKGFSAFGIDLSRLRAKRAKKFPEDNIAVCDAQKLCFSENSMDGIICLDVIEHVANPGQLLKEVARVLGKNGLLLLTTPNYPAKRIYDFFAKSYPFFGDDPTHISKFNYFKLKKLLEKNFSTVKISVNFSFFDKRLKNLKTQLRVAQLLFGHKLIAVCTNPKKHV